MVSHPCLFFSSRVARKRSSSAGAEASQDEDTARPLSSFPFPSRAETRDVRGTGFLCRRGDLDSAAPAVLPRAPKPGSHGCSFVLSDDDEGRRWLVAGTLQRSMIQFVRDSSTAWQLRLPSCYWFLLPPSSSGVRPWMPEPLNREASYDEWASDLSVKVWMPDLLFSYLTDQHCSIRTRMHGNSNSGTAHKGKKKA
jgi:hypothetical protein